MALPCGSSTLGLSVTKTLAFMRFSFPWPAPNRRVHFEAQNPERGILRHNIAFSVVNIIVSAPFTHYHLYKRTSSWQLHIQKAPRPPAHQVERPVWVSTQI